MNWTFFLSVIGLAAGGLMAYRQLVQIAWEYGNGWWEPPKGSEDSDWEVRRKTGYVLGIVGVIFAAIGVVYFLEEWPQRIGYMLEAAILAAAGTSDVRRYHLPLPLSMAGMVVAVVLAFMTQLPVWVIGFGFGWSLLMVIINSIGMKGSAQLGDHLATIWIGLVAPFNGILALLVGTLANVILKQVPGLRTRTIPIAGPWLIFAAMLVALPPFFNFIPQGLVTGQAAWPAEKTAQVVPKRYAPGIVQVIAGAQRVTARVGLEASRSKRISVASEASHTVAKLQTAARWMDADKETVQVLGELKEALANYDTGAVRSASADLADIRASLESQLEQYANASGEDKKS